MNKKRVSQNTIIEDDQKYLSFKDEYIDLLVTLQQKYQVESEPLFRNLVNFKCNKEIPKHNWMDYKHGYSEKLVEEIILRHTINEEQYILDPFTGVGTTNLVSQKLGFASIGFDINPVSILAAKVKTYYWNNNELLEIKNLINGSESFIESAEFPNSTLLANSFYESDFIDLMMIKGFYEKLESEKISDFFKLAYISIIEDCSNRVKDGNGIKYARDKQRIPNIFEYFRNKCRRMYDDILPFHPDKSIETEIYHGSILNRALWEEKLKGKKIGLVIFSPPYANCFDYFEVYKLEMWMGGFVKAYDDFKFYRSLAIRSHVNSNFDHTINNQNPNVKLIADMVSCFNIWNKNIPDMLRGYFDDMTNILRIIFDSLETNGKCHIVVANSGYRGILVPTDLLISDIANSIGFNISKISKARSIRASSQQMSFLHNTYSSLMRESIIELKKGM